MYWFSVPLVAHCSCFTQRLDPSMKLWWILTTARPWMNKYRVTLRLKVSRSQKSVRVNNGQLHTDVERIMKLLELITWQTRKKWRKRILYSELSTEIYETVEMETVEMHCMEFHDGKPDLVTVVWRLSPRVRVGVYIWTGKTFLFEDV